MKKYKTLGSLLIDFRVSQNISQSDLAAQFDVDIRSVIRWEKNESLLSSDKEKSMVEITFIPYQVIRNLNTANQIPTFYDFSIRKYSLSTISSDDLPDADWIKSRIDYNTDRIHRLNTSVDLPHIMRFIKLQKNPLKTRDTDVITEACKRLPELNLTIFDQSGYYSGHCIYFPIHMETYLKIRNREMHEDELETKHLIHHHQCEKPVFYCYSITADCNENFFYTLGAILKFFKELPNKNYLHTLLTTRHDAHVMSEQLELKTVWEDIEVQQKYKLDIAPRLIEGDFNAFFST